MRKPESGFTLMEILIALTILLVGIVGILALFPPGIVASKAAIEDSTAAIIAEGVHSALKTAFKGYDSATNSTANFVHDGVPANHQLVLPAAGGSQTYPTANIGAPPAPIYRLGTDMTRSDTKDDSLNQYSFDLFITYRNPAAGGVTGLYDIQIRIFRNYNTGVTKTDNMDSAGAKPTLLKIFYTQLGVN